MGAGKWAKIDPSPLYGGNVVIIADQDGPGRAHAHDVLSSLEGKAPVSRSSDRRTAATMRLIMSPLVTGSTSSNALTTSQRRAWRVTTTSSGMPATR
jgi:hypothetical protein